MKNDRPDRKGIGMGIMFHSFLVAAITLMFGLDAGIFMFIASSIALIACWIVPPDPDFPGRL
jgi:hypothetical protein